MRKASSVEFGSEGDTVVVITPLAPAGATAIPPNETWRYAVVFTKLPSYEYCKPVSLGGQGRQNSRQNGQPRQTGQNRQLRQGPRQGCLSLTSAKPAIQSLSHNSRNCGHYDIKGDST